MQGTEEEKFAEKTSQRLRRYSQAQLTFLNKAGGGEQRNFRLKKIQSSTLDAQGRRPAFLCSNDTKAFCKKKKKKKDSTENGMTTARVC